MAITTTAATTVAIAIAVTTPSDLASLLAYLRRRLAGRGAGLSCVSAMHRP